MPQSFSMSDGQKVATRASTEIEAWLREWDGTVSVENVEYEAVYQEKDIDLLWTTATRDYSIEIKADRNDGTGNFFFETISNKEKNTLGCFLKTQADFLFYYFVEPRTLYILPMPRTRQWFEENISRFEEREAATPVGKDHYITVGRIVPIEVVVKEVSGVKVKQL